MKTLLSIDFDFFTREDPMWDWGHSEEDPIFLRMAWIARYTSQDLYKETNIKKYADFMPKEMFFKLCWLGFKLQPNFKLRIAESHKWAFNEALDLKECQVFHFDAHHDLWKNEGRGVDCGNWLYKAIDRGYVKGVHWIAPSWLEAVGEKTLIADYQPKELQGHYFRELQENQFKDISIDTVFICRSGSWVPPHHDRDFVKMFSLFNTFTTNSDFVESIYVRKFPTRKESSIALKRNRELIKQFVPTNSVPT